MQPFRLMLLILPFLLGGYFLQPPAHAADRLSGLPAFIEQGMADWGIPGMAVAIVHHGEVVFAEGFGVRRPGDDGRVDKHTVFGMASLTKAMTATALGLLVDEGILQWDDRVKDHLPWFELSDPWVTQQVTIRDLLSHTVGIGRLTGNRLRFMPGRDGETIMGYVRHMPFEEPFRSGYVYSNMMYMVAGLVLEAASGRSWDEFLADRLFDPLGMEGASTSIARLDEQDNTAWPHQEFDGKVKVIPRRNFDNVGPAASVNASVMDMTRWVLLQLGEPGEYQGKELVSREVMHDIFQPRHAFPMSDPMSGQMSSYGLGWGIQHYEGYRVFQHGGATDGMTSRLVLLPEKNLGVIVASNLYCNFRPAVTNYVLDAILGIERETDWHEVFYGAYLETKASAMERRREIEARRVPDTGSGLPPVSYTGQYVHPVYDDAEVFIDEHGSLALQLWGDPEMIADLEHWHYNTFRASWRNKSMREKFITFDLDQFGNVSRMNVKFTLRQVLISVGIYPADYYRVVPYERLSP